MSTFFPKQTVEWRLEEPPAFRRLSLSVVEMGLVTGFMLRVLRALTFTHGRVSWLVWGAVLLLALGILLGMATAHLANFPVRQWTWRAPLFAAVEVAGEMITSLILIWLEREPEGTARAHFGDWPSMAMRTTLQTELIVLLWALLLAGVIVFVRRTSIARDVDSDPLDPDLPAPGVASDA